MENNWMNNPKLKNLDPAKLALLSSLATEGASKSQSEMLPFLLSAMQTADKKGINFEGEEKNLLLEVLMQQLSPDDKKKAETIIQMTSAFKK